MTSTDGHRTGVGFRSPAAACIGIVLWTIAIAGPALAQSEISPTWSAQLRSTAYLYQSETADGEKLSYAPLYENFDASVGRLAGDRLNLRVSGRYAADLGQDDVLITEDQLYIAYAGLRFDAAETRVRVGRMFLQEGTNRHSLDGAWVGFRPIEGWRVTAWGGGEAPVDRSFEASDFGDDAAYGVRVVGRVHPRARIGGWFATRQNGGETTSTPVGGEIMATPARGLRTLIRGAYDTERSELERIDLLAQLAPRRDLPTLTLQYIDRKPVIEGSSFFSIFADDLERISLLRGTLRHDLDNGFGGELEAARSAVDDRSTSRFGLAALVPYARVGLALTSGDAGEDLRWYGDVRYRFFERLDVSAGAVFAEYALVEDAPDDQVRDLVTAFVRTRYEVADGVRLRAEFQSLENPLFSTDTRVLLGLDLAAGRGASRFGIGSGGER